MRLLIIGKLHGHIGTATKVAMKRGAKVAQVESIQEALSFLRAGKGADLVMIDVALKVTDLVSQLLSERITLPVVACGIGTDPKTAVDAIKAGAKEYIPLPPNAELIAGVLETVAKDEDTLIHQDPVMERVIHLAEQIAPSDASVLITGESGTGKEVMARFIHQKSRRSSKAFVSINCAAIPENLLESELFGHEKGAFTGAVARRVGKFEEANGGTLLLDEVTEMDPSLQAKLLRAIQEREIDRVGGSKPVKVDIRILATSNRDMEQAVKEGHFREDLYFRLNVISLQIPPLRDRPMDIERLADYFVDKFSKENDFPPKTLDESAKKMLRHHVWRGNIRELENTLHRAVLLATGELISPDVLQLSGLKGKSATVSGEQEWEEETSFKNAFVGRSLAAVERDLILGTLGHCLGNRTQAASLLGISIRTLRNKLRQYTEDGEEVPQSRQEPRQDPYKNAVSS